MEVIQMKMPMADVQRITKTLKVIGIPANLLGYEYTREAIILAQEDRTIIRNITKQLYPTIARRFDTTSSRVERAIRHAVDIAWQRGSAQLQSSIFGYSIDSDKGKPTNSEFIATIADYLTITSEDV